MRLMGCLLVGLLLAGCAHTTMTPAQRERVDACLARCEASQSGPAQQNSSGWNDNNGIRDTRTSCERSCHHHK